MSQIHAGMLDGKNTKLINNRRSLKEVNIYYNYDYIFIIKYEVIVILNFIPCYHRE